ncbi:carboxymuconolactone decarboxylase family protein [Flagellimonas lutimaris]|uniref:carboxymuconolactone decarboxylase family protein n=1 Tax=Flagellimonas lutimaris TaxID=475082 RepID=UPI003F5CC456
MINKITHIFLIAILFMGNAFGQEQKSKNMTFISKEKHKEGIHNLKIIDGVAGEKVVESLEDISPDLATYIIEFAFGEIYARPLLDLKTKEIVVVAGLTAMGNVEPQLKVHLNAALNVGWAIVEIQEVILQMSVYSGFPSAVNGMNALKEVLAERKERGINDPKGINQQTKIPKDKTRLDIGIEQLEKLNAVSIDKLNEAYENVSPDFIKYVLEYGFADILARPGLDYKTREIVTIAALTSLGITNQLKLHIKGAMTLGVTKEEVAEIMILMGVFSGFPKAVNGTIVLKQVINE